ncbi:MAG: hypothetical protein ACJ75B_06750 [Flavisolibacter sp.]
MKIYFTFCLFFIGGFTVAQHEAKQIPMEYFKKYSYLLLGIKPKTNQIGTYFQHATCFFVRYKSELILITAKHAITGLSTSDLKPKAQQFDTLAIAYAEKSKPKYATMIITSIKSLLPDNYFYEDPDMAIIQFSDTSLKKNVFSLEEYIYEEKGEDEIIDSVFSFGYPRSGQNLTGNRIIKPELYKGNLADIIHIDPYYPKNDALYFVTTPAATEGMSGSPVFFKCHSINSGQQRIVFGGIVFGGSSKYNSAYIVPAKTVLQALKKFIHG